MDDQQVRLLVIERSLNMKRAAAKGWLAGMIDADGCITFQKRTRKGRLNIEPVVDISSVCPRLVDVLVATIKFLNCACFVARNSGKIRAVRISGLKRVERLLLEIAPYMTAKQVEAYMMIEFCGLRLSRKESKRDYTSEELSLYEDIGLMKANRNLRDYTPVPLWLNKGEDIVRSSAKSEDLSRNDLGTQLAVG